MTISRAQRTVLKSEIGVQIALWDSESNPTHFILNEKHQHHVSCRAVIRVEELPDLIKCLTEIMEAIGEAKSDQTKDQTPRKV